MFGLWVFGRAILPLTGERGFVHLYAAGAIVASAGHLVYQYVSGSPAPALGASGSVMAIAVVYAALFPRNTLLVGFFLPMPAAMAVGLFILIDVAGMIGGRGGIAHAAHLGGVAYGLAYYYSHFRPKPRKRR